MHNKPEAFKGDNKPEKMQRQTDRRTDRRTERQTDGQVGTQTFRLIEKKGVISINNYIN